MFVDGIREKKDSQKGNIFYFILFIFFFLFFFFWGGGGGVGPVLGGWVGARQTNIFLRSVQKRRRRLHRFKLIQERAAEVAASTTSVLI